MIEYDDVNKKKGYGYANIRFSTSKKNRKIALIACITVAISIAFTGCTEKNSKDSEYEKAIALMDKGNVIEAYEALIALDGYKDSAEKAKSICLKYVPEKIKASKVGDSVFFGSYEQDNDKSNGKENIEWLILEVKDGKALLFSKYALDLLVYSKYSSFDGYSSWEDSSLRRWLNDDFVNSAFFCW